MRQRHNSPHTKGKQAWSTAACLCAVDAMNNLHLQAQATQLAQREVCLGLVARQRDQISLPGHLRVLAALARAVAEAVPCLLPQSSLATHTLP